MRLSISLILVLFAMSAHADLLKNLSAAEQQQVQGGQTVVQSQDVKDGPWPKLMLYRVINAPMKVTWDLLSDFQSAPTYTPNMISAKLLSNNPNGSKNVEYTVKMPILQRMSYSVCNTYTKTPKYSEVSWTLIKSPFAKVSDGSLKIEPYPGNKTIMCYTNLVVPFTNLVAGLKNQALNEARTTIQAISAEAEKRAGAAK